jgi:hypothetical protein
MQQQFQGWRRYRRTLQKAQKFLQHKGPRAIWLAVLVGENQFGRRQPSNVENNEAAGCVFIMAMSTNPSDPSLLICKFDVVCE